MNSLPAVHKDQYPSISDIVAISSTQRSPVAVNAQPGGTRDESHIHDLAETNDGTTASDTPAQGFCTE
jgi:hypothetical protein